MPKISEQIAFHLPTGDYSPLALPWHHPCSKKAHESILVGGGAFCTNDFLGRSSFKDLKCSQKVHNLQNFLISEISI